MCFEIHKITITYVDLKIMLSALLLNHTSYTSYFCQEISIYYLSCFRQRETGI